MADASRVAGSRRSGVPRVYLRPPALSDRDRVLALNLASARFYRGLAAPMTNARAFAAYVARSQKPDYAGFLICRSGDDAVVGSVNLSQIARGPFKSAYMGYQVFAPFAAQGYMTAALPLILRHVFGTLRLHRVEANIQPQNTASIAVVRRAGFQCEGYSPRYLKVGGRWRDHERWAITVEAWKRARRVAKAGSQQGRKAQV